MATPATAVNMTRGRLAHNASMVGMLQSCLSSTESSLGTLPELLETIVEEGCWLHFKFPDGPEVRWNTADFRTFIEAKRPKGCETPFHVLEKAVLGTSAWETFKRLTRGEPGSPTWENLPRTNDGSFMRRNHDIITVSPDKPDLIDEPSATIPLSPDVPRTRKRDYAREADTGTSVSYNLRRLERGSAGKPPRPDLLEKVRKGEMSAWGAVVEAGYTPAKFSVPDDPEAAGRVLARHFRGERLEALFAALAKYSQDS